MNRPKKTKRQERELLDLDRIKAAAKRSIRIAENSSRYLPELDISLQIYDLGDWLCRSPRFWRDFSKTLNALIQSMKDLNRELSDELLQKKLVDITEEINAFRETFSLNLDKEIDWKNLHKILRSLRQFLDPLISFLHSTKEDSDDEKQKRKKEVLRNYAYHVLSKVTGVDAYCEEQRAEATNKRLLFLRGVAGIGKTHALSAMVSSLVSNDIPALLIFANQFREKCPVFPQLSKVSGLKETCPTTKCLFEQLQTLAENCDVRGLIIIDGLNEYSSPKRAQTFIKDVISCLSRYPNLSFLISVRSKLEHYYLPEDTLDSFPDIEHYGFREREWEAVRKFFSRYSIPLPEVPTLHSEFQNPLFLNLFCKTVEQRIRRLGRKEAFRGSWSMTDILEDYLIKVGDDVLRYLGLKRGRQKKGNHPIWDSIIKQIAKLQVSPKGNLQFVTERQLRKIIRQSGISKPVEKIIHGLEHANILAKFPVESGGRKEKFHYYFTYERFGSYLLTRYILNEIDFSKQESIKKAFSRKGKVGHIIDKGFYYSIINALSCHVPERTKGLELVDLCPWAKDIRHVQWAFLESLIWRNPSSFKYDSNGKASNAYDYFNHIWKHGRFYFWEILENLITTSPIPSHPFNARILDMFLRRLTMPERDCHWSAHTNLLASEDGGVERMLSWALSKSHHKDSSDEVILLLVTVLTWFLSSSNRRVRDRATKALIVLLEDRPRLWERYIRGFNDIDDLYIVERIYAVVYGCILRTSYKLHGKWLRKVALAVFQMNFENYPRPHVLLRDYARQIIEQAYKRNLLQELDIQKARPPYANEGSWELTARSEQEIDELISKNEKKYSWNCLSSIRLSVLYVGDFGRYIVESSFPFLNIPLSEPLPAEIKDEHRMDLELVKRWIFDRVIELGWSAKLHDDFDRGVRSSYRSNKKNVERIGKKYQWIALHEVIAHAADKYYHREIWGAFKESRFEGPWQERTSRRDIDPSVTLIQIPEYESGSTYWWKGVHNIDWQDSKSNLEWLSSKDNIINIRDVLRVRRPRGKKHFLNLNGISVWEQRSYAERKEHNTDARSFFVKIKSFLIDKKLFTDGLNYFTSEMGSYDGTFKEIEWHYLFLGELYNSVPYKIRLAEIEPDYFPWKNTGWEGLLSDIAPTAEQYSWSEDRYDGSIDSSISFTIPSHQLINLAALQYRGKEGMYFNDQRQPVAFDPSVQEQGASVLLMEEKEVKSMLKKTGLDLIWSIHAGKEIYTEHGGERPGFLRILGAIAYNNGNMQSHLSTHFEDWRR